ncbi:MAG: hypothetical protein NVS4B1_14810 [Ktedonobacteraceae bacterium]
MPLFDIEYGAIAHYKLEALLAHGGMSVVYLARDTHTDQQVAIKLVHASEHDYYVRFQNEAKTLASLGNEHIMPIFDYGEYASWFYMAMPYIAYGSLRERLAEGILPLQDVEKILAQLVDAVQYAHDRGIVHRDIKPSNILLRDGEHVYLADFGLVKNVEEMSDLTQTGCLLGTPEYMAPELTEHPATPSSDIYALGIVLYFMLTGQVPFKGGTPISVFMKHMHEQPVVPSTYNPALSPAIDRVVLHALVKSPKERIQNANDLLHAFRDAIHHEQKAIVNVVKVSSIPTIPSIMIRRRLFAISHRNTTFLSSAIHRTMNIRIGALLLLAILLLFIVPMLFSLSFLHGYDRSQVSQSLHTSNSSVRNQAPTKTPTIHPTLVASKAPTTRSTPTSNKKPAQQRSNALVPLPVSDTSGSNKQGSKSGGDDKSGRGNGNHGDHGGGDG